MLKNNAKTIALGAITGATLFVGSQLLHSEPLTVQEWQLLMDARNAYLERNGGVVTLDGQRPIEHINELMLAENPTEVRLPERVCDEEGKCVKEERVYSTEEYKALLKTLIR